MAKRFVDGVDQLLTQVGTGDLTGHLVADQVYARYQEVGLSRFSGRPLQHHRGGRSRYLHAALTVGVTEYMQRLARSAVTREGSDLRAAMVHNMEDVAARMQHYAPILYNVLKRSAHPSVTDDGVTVYDRPPLARRLTEEELRHRPRRRSPRPGLRRRR